MKRILTAALVLLLSGVAAHGVTRPPVIRYVLDNGMTVILEENHQMPWVSVNIFVRSGSSWEDDKTNGISHFSEHMFFRGTTHRSGAETKAQIEALGGVTDAETTKDFTHFYVNVPSVHTQEIMDILADALINPALDPKAIDIERNAVDDEYKMDADGPMDELEERLYQLAFKVHPYRMSVIGTEANILRWKQPDFIAWRHKFYVPERTALVIVGDFDSDALRPRIQEDFGPFASTGIAVAPLPPEPPIAQTVTVRQPAKLHGGFALIGFRAPSVTHFTDVCAVDVLTFMLGQGKTSLLNKALVTDKELAVQADLDFLTQRDDGMLVLSLAASSDRLPAAETAALDLLASVREGKFTDADLERARQMVISEYSLGNETDAGEAGSLGFYEMIGKLDMASRYVDSVRHVSREDVIAAARTYLGASYIQVTALPRGMLGQGGDSPSTLPKPTTSVK
ncbi:MAG TPA: pitrilysin family protein [Candidatus Xenobia bacterium]|jgi:zinc protease